MGFVKQLARRTPLYGILHRFRARRQARRWTSHDDEMVRFYSQFVASGDVCFDVGANVGNRTRVFLALDATVVAVEPQIECLRTLKAVCGENSRLVVVPSVLGAVDGEAELMLTNSSTIASLSRTWIDAVQQSGRFAEYTWQRRQTVPMTTLDRLIEQYGRPTFIKIDVEGFELEVLRGLSQPVRTLSFEFTPEIIDSTVECLQLLRTLGDIRVNYATGESMQLALPEWMTLEDASSRLLSYRGDHQTFGDVYVQFLTLMPQLG